MSSNEAPLTLTDLMARVGYLILYWSTFEQTLNQNIVAMGERLGDEKKEVRGGLKDRLDIWAALATRLPENADRLHLADQLCEQALWLRDVRNLIVHGLVGGDAQPRGGEQGAIKCLVGGFEAPTGEIVRFTIADLDHYTQGVDACRRGCERLASFNYRIQGGGPSIHAKPQAT